MSGAERQSTRHRRRADGLNSTIRKLTFGQDGDIYRNGLKNIWFTVPKLTAGRWGFPAARRILGRRS